MSWFWLIIGLIIGGCIGFVWGMNQGESRFLRKLRLRKR